MFDASACERRGMCSGTLERRIVHDRDGGSFDTRTAVENAKDAGAVLYCTSCTMIFFNCHVHQLKKITNFYSDTWHTFKRAAT